MFELHDFNDFLFNQTRYFKEQQMRHAVTKQKVRMPSENDMLHQMSTCVTLAHVRKSLPMSSSVIVETVTVCSPKSWVMLSGF